MKTTRPMKTLFEALHDEDNHDVIFKIPDDLTAEEASTLSIQAIALYVRYMALDCGIGYDNAFELIKAATEELDKQIDNQYNPQA